MGPRQPGRYSGSSRPVLAMGVLQIVHMLTPRLALLEGFHRRCCNACSQRYRGKGPFADQAARH